MDNNLADRAEAGEDATVLPPLCDDLDEDCHDIPDKLHCWLYDPMKGSCPWLIARSQADGR